MDERRKIIFRWLIGTPFIIGTVAFLLDGAPIHPDRVGTSEEVEREVEQAWRKLDGFRRESYLAFIRYHALRKKLLQKLETEGIVLDDAELGEAEHVRWSRFYHLNHWRQGIPTGDGAPFSAGDVETSLPYTGAVRAATLHAVGCSGHSVVGTVRVCAQRAVRDKRPPQGGPA